MAVVTDFCPLRVPLAWSESAAAALEGKMPVFQVTYFPSASLSASDPWAVPE
jgi:hypothetical protein